MVDRLGVWLGAPSSGSAPMRGMKPTTPQWQAGLRIEPPLSVPMFTCASPTAAATPAPVDDPPAVRSTSQGLRPIGSNAFVTPYIASAESVVVRSTTPPALRARATTAASCDAIRPAWIAEPSVQGRPATGRFPFTLTVNAPSPGAGARCENAR